MLYFDCFVNRIEETLEYGATLVFVLGSFEVQLVLTFCCDELNGPFLSDQLFVLHQQELGGEGFLGHQNIC